MSGIQIVITALIFLFSNGTNTQNKTLTLSYGSLQSESGAYSFSTDEHKKVGDITLQLPAMKEKLGLRYGISGMYTENGTHLIGAGFSKTIAPIKFAKNLEFTMLFHPSYTYVGGVDNKRISFPINLRTSTDANYRFSENFTAGIGLTHMSNGTVRHPNNGLDIVKVNIGYDFK